MAKIDRFRSPEEAERLADLKRGVDLGALATERYGYTLSERTREGGFTLRNEASGGGDRITVKMAPEGYHIYHNHNNDRDNGSVVDFLQQRHPDRNLGQVKGMLQEMVPGAKSALDYEKFAAQQVLKAPGAADARYEALPASERRAAMVRETMGPNPQLTDASYLLERGLSKETVNDLAFKNRVFTDQHPERQERGGVAQHNVGFPFYNEKGVQSFELRNRAPEGETDSFKMMMKAPGDEFGAKNGVWSSNTLQGRGTQPERLIVGESPIDMMSKYQTERAAATAKGEEMPNSRYVATGGTPSIEQKAIIQNLIDREQPKQVILSNDNDAAGQAFNVRYLNDLRPPQAGLSPEQLAEAAAARERTTWIAGDNGKKGEEKLLTMTISFKHETARDGRQAVESLRTQAEMRGLPAEEPTAPNTAGLQVRRNATEVTEVVLRVAPAQAEAVVDLARELRRERELAMPEAARTPENYFVVEKANGKDYNQDLLQGRADAQLDAARREAGFTVAPEVAPVVAAAPEIALERAQLRVSDNEPLPVPVIEAAAKAPEMFDVLERFNPDPEKSWAKLGYPGSATAALNQPGPEVSRLLVEAGATLIERPVSELAPAGTQSIAYPLDQPEVVAKVGLVLSELQASADDRARDRDSKRVIFEDPAYRQTREQALAAFEQTPGGREELERLANLSYRAERVDLTTEAMGRQVRDQQYVEWGREDNGEVRAVLQATASVEGSLSRNEELAFVAAGAALVDKGNHTDVVYPIDNPASVAHVSTLLDQVDANARWVDYEREVRTHEIAEHPDDREARRTVTHAWQQANPEVSLAARLEDWTSGTPGTLESGNEAVLSAALRDPVAAEVVRLEAYDREQGLMAEQAKVAIGYPGNQDFYKDQLVAAGATLIEQPVSEYAPAGTYSIRYPLDQPEVAARVGDTLDTIEKNARTGSTMHVDGPIGIFEQPGDNEKRHLSAAQWDGQTLGDQVREENRLGAQAAAADQTATPQIYADINLNGSTSADEIIRADINHDGKVTDTELTQARYEINQANERNAADALGQNEAERQAEIRRRYEADVQQQVEQQQQQQQQQQEQQATQRDTSGPLIGAAFVIFEAEALPAGTLAAGSATLVTLSDKIKEAIESQGSEVSVREGRDATTQQPYAMLSFQYHEGSAEHGKIQETLRDALREGGVSKYFGITPSEEVQRETAPITRTVALHEQPLAIALDAPNPLLESQLRATGATVSNESVQDRPGLVVVVDTNKGEQLAGVEQTLTRLPAAALVVEGPEAHEMRQQLTLTFREQGGVAPTLQAEAILPERVQNDVPERLREAGATVTPAIYADRPELPENTLSVRYPLDQPEVMGRVSVVLDQVNSRSAQVANDLGTAPDVSTGSVVETPLAQQTRQLMAKEQGLEAPGPRELPERQPTEDRPIDRPKSVVIVDSPEQQQQQQAAASAETGRTISATPEAHAIERRIILDISPEKTAVVPALEASLARGGFQLAVAPIEAAGEEKGGTRIEALYRTTDSMAQREAQARQLDIASKIDPAYLTLREPEGQAQERAAALKGPGKPEANQMIAAGQTLRANITVLEVDGEKDRATRLWTDLRDAGAKVGHVAKTELPGEGTKYAFPVEYRPSDLRLAQVSATLEAAARGEGIQVIETDNMRLERLSRTAARESKSLAALTPEAREAYVRPEPKDYSASRPTAYERVAVSAQELETPAAVKALREALKETGALVAVQQLDGRPAGSGTVTLSFISDAPKAEAVNEVLRSIAERGGTVYDLKAGQDRGGEAAQQAVETLARPLNAEQERDANLAEMRTLEARRDALRASQQEATTQSQLAEQYLVPVVAATAVVVLETVAAKPWVGFGPDLRGEDLRNTDATGMDLRGANLAGQDLRSTDLRGSDLREANLMGADLRGANLTGVRLEDAVLDGARLEQTFRVVENSEGKRQMEENLTPAVLTGPERDGSGYAPTVALNEQRLATPEMVAAGEDNSPAASPRLAQLQAPQYSGLGLPTEEEVRTQEKMSVVPGIVEAPVLEATASAQGQTLLAEQPERPGLSLPIQQELSFITPPVEPVVELPAVAAASPERAPGAAQGALTAYELLEEAGTAQHVASIQLTQPVGEGTDRAQGIYDRLLAAGAEVERVPGPTPGTDGKTETYALLVVYAHDDRELPAVHKELAEIVNVPAGADYGVRVEDENAAGRAATVGSRLENTPEAAKALATELHDGDQSTARLLIQRPALEDVWALEDAGAKVERLYLPDGPAAMVSYPTNEPGLTSAVSIELDRIERDSTLSRPPHNSNDREVSGPLLGEDPTQQERRQEMAKAEGLVLEPQPRYELHEMAERDARAKQYFQEEIARPSDPMSGQLANGEPFKGSLTEVLRLEQPDREALEAGWKAERTTLLLVVQETPEVRMDEPGPAAWPTRVAEALREAGAEAQVKDLGVSPDTGLEKHLVAITFDNNDPALARIQATLNRLADQDGVQVPAEGYWQREALLGPNGSRMAEPVVAERDRPWLEAVVAINDPTDQERRELTRAGARIEEARFAENDNKPAILVYYNLDNPTEVAKVSAVLDRADEAGRGLGETNEARDARAGRVEQVQADIRQEKQQSGEAWEQLAQRHPGVGARVENEAAEPAVALSFADRIRAAVNDRIEYVRQGLEYGSPENIAVYQAEQRGIADRKALEQQQKTLDQQQATDAAATPHKEREKDAYERGFKGPAEAEKSAEKAPAAPDAAEKIGVVPVTPAEIAAQAALSGGVAPGTHGTSAELATDKVLRERRDDELTKPIVMDAPKEGKILETTEQVVKPSTVGTPDQERAAGEKAVTPPVVETPAVAAAVVTATEAEKSREKELQYGLIGMGDSSKNSAEDRMERVRAALAGAGATVEAVVPPTREHKDALLAYSYDPLDKQLPEINTVLANVHKAQPSMIKEEPHSLHYAGITPNAHEIPKQDWPEREGQFSKAHIVVDDFDQKGTARAENIKGDLAREGTVVGEVKKDGHGHVEMDITYHSHTPNIDQINRTLDRAGNSPGIEVQESNTDRTARYQGAIDQLQSKGAEKERERGE